MNLTDLNIQALHNPIRVDANGPDIIHEKTEHRALILMKARGCSNKEIAEATGYGKIYIGKILAQPWAQDRVLRLMHVKGEPGIEENLKLKCKDAIQIAYEVMMTTENENLKSKNAFEFLKLQMGSKVVVSQSTPPKDQLDDEIKRKMEEIKTLESGGLAQPEGTSTVS